MLYLPESGLRYFPYAIKSERGMEWETEIGPKEQGHLFMSACSTLQPPLPLSPYPASKWQAQIVLPGRNFDSVTEPKRSPIGWSK